MIIIGMIFYNESQNIWTTDVIPDSLMIVCEMVMPPIKLKQHQKYQGEIEGGVLTKGKYKLIILYSFTEIAWGDEIKNLEYPFNVFE
ncbi:MAG: hypothetical protein V3U02_12275 [Calditrichia bacterium]